MKEISAQLVPILYFCLSMLSQRYALSHIIVLSLSLFFPHPGKSRSKLNEKSYLTPLPLLSGFSLRPSGWHSSLSSSPSTSSQLGGGGGRIFLWNEGLIIALLLQQ